MIKPVLERLGLKARFRSVVNRDSVLQGKLSGVRSPRNSAHSTRCSRYDDHWIWNGSDEDRPRRRGGNLGQSGWLTRLGVRTIPEQHVSVMRTRPIHLRLEGKRFRCRSRRGPTDTNPRIEISSRRLGQSLLRHRRHIGPDAGSDCRNGRLEEIPRAQRRGAPVGTKWHA